MTDWAQPLNHPPVNPPDRAKRAAQLARWRARSKVIKIWRRILPATMAAICLAVLTWIGVQTALGMLSGGGAATIRMLNPRLYGRDDNGRSFRIEAKEAVRDGRYPDRVSLTTPSLLLDAGDSKSLTASAKLGVYDQRLRALDLTGAVQIANGRGYRFASDTGRIDTKKGLISGNSSVVGEGPLGRIAASSYAIHEQEGRAVFHGNVQTHVWNK